MATETDTDKKSRKTERAYFNAAGETSKRPTKDTIGFAIKDISETNGRSLRRAFDEYPPAIRNCAMAFGFVTVLGNTIGKKDSSFDDLLARDEVFMAGEWADTAESGPRISVLAQAVVRAAKGQGKDYQLDKVTERLKSMDDAARKSMKDDPAIAAAFAEIQLEAAKARAAETKKALKDSGGSSVLDSFA